MAERSKLEQIQTDLEEAKQAGKLVIAGQFFHLSINPGFPVLDKELAYKEEVMFFVAPPSKVEISGNSLNKFYSGLTSVGAQVASEFFGGVGVYNDQPYYQDLQLGSRISYEYIPGELLIFDTLKPRLLDPQAQLRAETITNPLGLRSLPAQRAITIYCYPDPAPAEVAFLYTSALLTGSMLANPAMDELYKVLRKDAVRELAEGRNPYANMALTIPRPLRTPTP